MSLPKWYRTAGIGSRVKRKEALAMLAFREFGGYNTSEIVVCDGLPAYGVYSQPTVDGRAANV